MKMIVKILISILLLGCLAKMPYGYFQFVRVVSCVGFIWLANEYKDKMYVLLGCVGAAILFNPLFKIHFTRKLWNPIDVIIAVSLILWVIIEIVPLKHERKETHKEKAR